MLAASRGAASIPRRFYEHDALASDPMQFVFPSMTDQASPVPRHRTPAVDHGQQNKREVLEQTRPKHHGDRQRIVVLLQELGDLGATRHEIADRLRLPLTTVCGRVNELKKMGEVTEPGTRRLTPHGKTAVVVVWKA